MSSATIFPDQIRDEVAKSVPATHTNTVDPGAVRMNAGLKPILPPMTDTTDTGKVRVGAGLHVRKG